MLIVLILLIVICPTGIIATGNNVNPYSGPALPELFLGKGEGETDIGIAMLFLCALHKSAFFIAK